MLNQQPSTSRANDAGHPARPESTRQVDEVPLSGLSRASWKYTARKAWTEFNRDQCTDLAAALTYYAVLSLFPAAARPGVAARRLRPGGVDDDALLDMSAQMGQGDAADQLRGPLDQLTQSNAAGFALVLGLLGAIWSASAYVGAFGRAMNRIYEIEEGRPIWKLRPLQLGWSRSWSCSWSRRCSSGSCSPGPSPRSVGDAVGLG